MTPKRLILSVLTIGILLFVGLSLVGSWLQPQIQSRLELYQTNLILHATQWEGLTADDANLKSASANFLGENPLQAAQKQYDAARKSAQRSLEQTTAQLKQLQPSLSSPKSIARQQKPLEELIDELEALINELDLHAGILQAQQGQTDAAIQTWKGVIERGKTQPDTEVAAKTAAILTGLWSNPPRLLPDAQQWINRQLDGWFRYQALTRLYQLQQRNEALLDLQAQEQEVAEQAVVKLAILSGIPIIGVLIGTGLLIFLIVQRLLKGNASLLGQNENMPWETPWNVETIWQVFVLGFFGMQLLISLIVVPIGLKLLNINSASFDLRSKAISILVTYVLVALGAVFVVYLSVKQFLPLATDWFRFNLLSNWFVWGFAGYFAAMPLVIVVSLINQLIWQGKGGSNPLLTLALENQDRVALLVFFITAAIAAPLFEEFLFRGFLLPSLTRYMPVWAAIATSSLLFAVAHLSLSEVLPLATLGMVLGIVYTRSRNLLAPILLHSLWNSGTLLNLFILGSGSN